MKVSGADLCQVRRLAWAGCREGDNEEEGTADAGDAEVPLAGAGAGVLPAGAGNSARCQGLGHTARK